jgi:CheY-like chemotaxis protein
MAPPVICRLPVIYRILNFSGYIAIQILEDQFIMDKGGEIIIIEDDIDDQELLKDIFKSLEVPNQIVFFPNGINALEYLQQPQVVPFLILSDINLPLLDGFALRDRIFQNEEISKKCIPYVFFTTSANEKAVSTAYALSAQGFFQKPTSYAELQAIIKCILEYWKHCYAPNQFRQS